LRNTAQTSDEALLVGFGKDTPDVDKFFRDEAHHLRAL
jgi:hypothetical protein